MYNIKLFLFFLFLNLYNNQQIVDFTKTLELSNYFSINENTITTIRYTEYIFIGTCFDKNILIYSSSTIHLNSFTLISSGKLTPLIIDTNINFELFV